MERRKCFNSSLCNCSKKRLEAIKNGTWKPKPKTTLRKVSVKARKRVKDYRETAFTAFGCQCELCGIRLPMTKLVVHHFRRKRFTKDDSLDNLCVLCERCHTYAHKNDNEHYDEVKEKILRRRS